MLPLPIRNGVGAVPTRALCALGFVSFFGFTNCHQFQHAKRPPARGQRSLASSRDGSTFRQVVEQSRLERLQSALRLAEEVCLRLALPLPAA